MRRAFFFGFLTLFLVIILLFVGIPILIRLAVFLGEVKKTPEAIDTGDTFPPPPVRMHPLPEATNSARLSLSGFAEAGSTVEIFLDDSFAFKVLTKNDGTFLTNSLELENGNNEIYAIAIDEAGNKSLESEKQLVYLDVSQPDLSVTEPEDGATISGPENTIIVKGVSEADVDLRLNGRVVLVDQEGNFSHQLSLVEGENQIRLIATDKAGNTTEKEIVLNFQP